MITIETTRSSMLTKLQYDENTMELTITYAGGAEYRYSDVPKETFDTLVNSESQGKFVNAHIKGKFTAERI